MDVLLLLRLIPTLTFASLYYFFVRPSVAPKAEKIWKTRTPHWGEFVFTRILRAFT